MLKITSKKLLLGSLAAVCLSGTALAIDTTITFSEGHPGGSLNGDPFYDAFGVSFTDALLFAGDVRLPDDGAGITNDGTPSMSAAFTNPQSLVSFTWATPGDGVDFHATAYNAANIMVDAFHYIDSPGGDSVNGVASLSGAGIVRIVFNDGGNQVAVDTLTFDGPGVPDAGATAGLLGLALAGLAAVRHARRS